jgi:porin
MRSQKALKVLLLVVIGSIAFHPIGLAYEIDDRLSVGGVLAGAGQYQDLIDSNGADSKGRGAFAFQPELSFTPNQNGEILIKAGFAAGNGLNEISPFVLAPWAADLEDNVRDINGRKRDYLLTAWYKHTLPLGEQHTLGITGGLIDATDYLDTNAFANDEYTQFMNEALVNGPSGFFPSYDLGGALEWDLRNIGLRCVIMNVGENDDGNNFSFIGIQLGYTLKTSLGEGNYRIIIDATTRDFLDPSGQEKEHRAAIILSFDQEFGPIFGGFLRF